jgi:hypothetical protein
VAQTACYVTHAPLLPSFLRCYKQKKIASHGGFSEQVGVAVMYHIYFYSGNVPVRISAGKLATWIEVFRGLPQSLMANIGIVRGFGHESFLPNPFQFTIIFSLLSLF